MSGGAKVVIGADVREVKPALDSVARSVQQLDGQTNGTFQGWVGNSNAVATATEKLERQLKSFASEQRQQGRMARFYANELASIIPAAGGAKDAIQGLVGLGIEGLAGGFGIGLAIEGVKLGVEVFHMLTAESKEAAEAMKKTEESIAALGDHLQQLRSEGMTPLEREEKKLNDLLQVQARRTKAEQDYLALVETGTAEQVAAAQEYMLGIMAAFPALDRQLSLQRQATEEVRNRAALAALPQYGPGNDVGAGAFAVQAERAAKARERAAAAAKEESREQARIAALIESTMERMGGAAAADRGNFPGMFYSQATADQLAAAATERDLKPWMESVGKGAKGDGFATDLVDPTNMLGSPDDLVRIQSFDEAMKSAAKSGNELASIGDSIGNAFGSIGAAMGGIAGAIAGQIGQIAALTLKFVGLAIAAAEASAAETPVVGWVAAIGAGAAVAASVMGLLGSVGARADGGPVSGYGTYLVGERGPELLQMGPQSGNIIPNDELGGGNVNVTINAAALDATWWRQNERHIVRTLREASRGGRA